MGNREELERFKTDINIADVAISMGFEIDNKKSSRKSIVLKSGSDVIVVSRNSNGHYVYFNPNNLKDAGTIIDFIQNRTNYNLGQVRKVLRQYLQSGNRMQHLEISNQSDIKQRYLISKKFESMWEDIYKNKANIKYEIFSDDVRGIELDTLNNVNYIALKDNKFYFPIFGTDGICGLYYTDLSMKEKYFSKGSIKGIWADKKISKDITKIIITESPIDSLSAIELKKGDKDEHTTLHIATLGRMGEEAKETLKKVFKYLPNTELIIATDQDQAGEEIAKEIAELAREAGLNNVNRLTIPNAKDLNEYLVKEKERQKEEMAYSYSRGMSR